MEHSLAFAETFLNSLASFPRLEISGNFGKNWTPSQPILPCLDPIIYTLNFSNGIQNLSVNALDFVKSIKSLVNENSSLLKKGKAINDWKCLLDYPNIQDNDTLTVFSKSSKGTGENVDLASLVQTPVKKRETVDPLAESREESREFLRELNLLLEKYKINKEQVILLLQKD